MTQNTAQPLAHDGAHVVMSKELAKSGDLLGIGSLSFQSKDTTLEIRNRVNQSRNDIGGQDLSPRLAALSDRRKQVGLDEVRDGSGLIDGPCLDDRKQPVSLYVAHNSSPSVVDAGAHSVGDGPAAGDASATPATEVTDPHISARYDAPLNAIAMSVGGTDDLYFDRDATFLLVDELRAALHEQAKNGGLA